MRSLLKISLVFSIVFFLGCKKDTLENTVICTTCEVEGCIDYQFPGEVSFETFINTGIQYTLPTFNPNNSDEFVYVRHDFVGNNKLVKHQISTGNEVILHSSNYILEQPVWSKTGWILLTVDIGINHLARVFEDGTGFEIISGTGNECLKYSLSDNDSRIVGEFTNYVEYGNATILNLNGDLIDSMNILYGSRKIGYPMAIQETYQNGIYTFYDNSTAKYGICKRINDSVIEEYLTVDGFISNLCSNKYGIYYVVYQQGLFFYSFSTNEITLLNKNCKSRYINSLDFSPDGKTLIYEVIRGVPTGFEQEIDLQSEIYTMNILNKQRKAILIE